MPMYRHPVVMPIQVYSTHALIPHTHKREEKSIQIARLPYEIWLDLILCLCECVVCRCEWHLGEMWIFLQGTWTMKHLWGQIVRLTYIKCKVNLYLLLFQAIVLLIFFLYCRVVSAMKLNLPLTPEIEAIQFGCGMNKCFWLKVEGYWLGPSLVSLFFPHLFLRQFVLNGPFYAKDNILNERLLEISTIAMHLTRLIR